MRWERGCPGKGFMFTKSSNFPKVLNYYDS